MVPPEPATAREEAATDPCALMLRQVRAAGLKVTPQRLAIIRELAGDPTHPTAQELFDRLQPVLPTMSFATVYNTLSSLSDAGLCVARTLGRGCARFDPNTAPHDHAVCDGCGDVIDVPQDAQRSAVPLAGFEVRAVERVYRGRCVRCASARDGRAATSADPTSAGDSEAAPG